MGEQPTEDVLIDSSSLFRAFRDKVLLGNLIQWGQRGNRRLILSPLVIEEMLDHAEGDKVIEQIVLLGEVSRTLGPHHFSCTRMPQDSFCLEAKNLLTSTPPATEEESKVFNDFFDSRDTARQFIDSQRSGEQRRASAWKDELLAADRKIQEKAAALRAAGKPGFEPAGIQQFILNYNGPPEDSVVVVPTVEEVAKKSGVAITMRDIVKTPRRYPILYTWACMAELTAWGNAFPRGDGSIVAQNIKTERGSWFDNSIAAASALCRLVLTQDTGFKWKIQHLNDRGLINVAASSIEEAVGAF